LSIALYDFILENRTEIIARSRDRAIERMPGNLSEAKLVHGVPLFLTQLADSLATAAVYSALYLVRATDAHRNITETAALHGEELLANGFSAAQVVHGYGDVCQIVTELATDRGVVISARDFRAFNRCLDDAISGAVTAYGRQRERDVVEAGTERMGVLVHELRNLINTATLSFNVIRRGTVGLGGSTGAVLARSLAGLSTVVERSLAEVRLDAGTVRLQCVSVADFIEEVKVSAVLQAESSGIELSVEAVDGELSIDADWYLLTSALSNLLQNAFKFTPAQGTVVLCVRATAERVLFDVADQCGGLPPGKTEELFRPFTQASPDRSGLGLGLSIALSAVRANRGELSVLNVPGKGCVFTIDLPRHSRAAPKQNERSWRAV
jgi:signal transduction histidine kinase